MGEIISRVVVTPMVLVVSIHSTDDIPTQC